MTTTFEQAVTDIKAEWTKFEGWAENEEAVIATAAKNFYSNFEPKLLADLTTLANDLKQDLVDNPSTAFTTLLQQAENLGSEAWNAMKPALQTSLLQTIAGAASSAVLALL
jgi:hypothetical protein